MLVEKYGWTVQKSLFAETNQNSTFSHIRENKKMFNITSKYFSFFNNILLLIIIIHEYLHRIGTSV